MIENFTLDTDANPQNMNKLIEGINKNEEDITAVKKSVEGVSSQIGQIIDKEMYPVKVIADLNLKIDGDRFSCKLPLPLNSPTTNAFYCDTVVWKDNSNFVEQIVREIAFGRFFRRVKNVTGWQPWIEIATTDKIEIPVPYNVGYGHDSTFEYASKIIVNKFKQARIYFNVKKLNNETFKVNEEFAVATLPDSYKARFWVAGACTSSHSTICKNNCVIFSNFLFVRCLTESVAITGYLDYEVV